MKKKIIKAVAVAAIVVGFSAVSASAWNQGMPMMGGAGYGMVNGQGAPAMSQELLNELNGLRKNIAADQIELNAIMAGPNPDSVRIRQLSEKIATNQIAIQDKSGSYRNYGQRNGGYGMMGGPGMGMMNGGYGMMGGSGMGMMNGGYGMMGMGGYGCW